MPFNGPARVIAEDFGDGHLVAFLQNSAGVYCTQCGTVYVRADGRDCPACALAEMIDELDESTLSCIQRIEARIEDDQDDEEDPHAGKPAAEPGGPGRDI